MPLILLLHWDGLVERPGRGSKPKPAAVVRRLVAERGAALADVARVTVYRKQPRVRDNEVANANIGKWGRRHQRVLRALLPDSDSKVALHLELWHEDEQRWVCKEHETAIACDVLVHLVDTPGADVVLVTDSPEFTSLENRIRDLPEGIERFTMLTWDSFAPVVT